MAAESRGGPAGDDTVAGYRPVSAPAVAAAVVGLASVLALVGPAFWVLPLVGTAVAVAGLADVRRRDAPKAGRLAALAGLALSLGFAAQAVATAGTAEWLARGRARAAAQFWLDSIAAGRLDDARSMCGPGAEAAVDRAAGCGGDAPARVRCRGRDAATGGRMVRAAVGACELDIVIEATPPRRAGDPERLVIARCDAVTPSAN